MNEGKTFTILDLARDLAAGLSLTGLIVTICIFAAAHTPVHIPV